MRFPHTRILLFFIFIYQYDTVGGADVELEFEVRHEDELVGIINKIKEKFTDAIRYVEFYRFTKEHKIIYFPPVEG